MMNSNAAMNSLTKNYFLLALFVIHSATSDESQISKNFKKNLTEISNTEHEDNHRYKNQTLFLMNKMDKLLELEEQQKIRSCKLDFLERLIDHRVQIRESRKNTLNQISKMMYDIENMKYLMKKSLKKAQNPETLEDLIGHAWNDKLWNEQVESLNQLEELKQKLSEWEDEIESPTHFNHVSKVIRNILRPEENSTEVPLKMSWNDPNNEEPLLKFDIDLECDELEKLRRFSLIIQDELNEMPKLRHEIPEDHEKSQSKPQDALPEVADLPLWLLNEKDIEEIQEDYINWMSTFANPEKERAKQLKENIIKSGQSINYFSKMLAELLNLIRKSLECKAKDDTECEEIINEMMNREHFIKITKVFFAGTKREELTLNKDFKL
ncbi:uncharacterized protein LOC135835207 [Planococcus citri]|uniref:uncharacterized protein LOC135835207 n=1 Tax=Planococcus citri TaxID=170843 RepID=UPI0031F7672B